MTIPSASELLNPDLYLIGDAGVTKSGSDVTSWADQSGNGNDFTGPVGARPLTATGQGGRVYMDLASSKRLEGGRPASLEFTDNEYTIVMVLNANGAANFATPISKGGVNGGAGIWLLFSSGVFSQIAKLGAVFAKGPQICVFRSNGDGTSTLNVNGIEWVDSSHVAWQANGDWIIGASSTNAYYFNLPFYSACAWGSVLTDQQVSDVVATMGDYYQIGYYGKPNGQSQVVLWGNSLVQGDNAAYPNDNSNRLARSIRGANVIQKGTNGRTITSLAAEFASKITPVYNASRYEKNILWIYEYVNQMATGGADDTPENAYALYKTLCQTATTAGWTVIANTVHYNGFDTTAEVDTVNASMRSDFNVPTNDPHIFLPADGITYADRMIDFALDPLIGTLAAKTNTTYVADTVHWSSEGYAVAMAKVAAAVNQINLSAPATSTPTQRIYSPYQANNI